MFKKMIAFAVCLCVLATLVTVPVSADCTSYYFDSFEAGSGSVVSLTSGGDYYASSGDNGVLVQPAELTWSKHVTLSENMGYDGTGGLYLHADTSKKAGTGYRLAEIMTRGVTLEEGTEAVLKYRVKFLALEGEDTAAPSTNYMYMSVIGGSETSGSSSTRAMCAVTPNSFEKDKWYTIVNKVTGTGATKAVTSYVLNEDNTVKSTTTKNITISIGSDYTAETQPVRFWPVYVPMNLELQRHLVVDDVTLAKYTTAGTQKIGLDAIYTDIEDGDSEIGIDKRFHLSFDHDLASGAPDEVKLYKKSDMNTPIDCTVSSKTFNSFTLTPDDLLETGTEYVLDLSAVTSASGQTISDSSKTISFKTVEAEAADTVTYVSAQTVSGAALSAVPTDDSIKLTFDSEILLPEADTDVVLCKTSDLTKSPVSVAIELSDDAKSITVTPSSALSLDTNYTIDFSGVLSTLAGKLEGTSTVAFTTVATRDMIYLTDNLEDATTGATTTYSSDILTNTSMYINIANGEGFEGGKGLIWDNSSNPNSTVRVASQPYALDEKETLFFEYKMRLNDIAINEDGQTQAAYFCVADGTSTSISSGTTMFKIFKTSDGYFLTNRTQSSEKRLVWDRDTWYTVIYKVGRNAQTAYLMDEDGNVVLESSYTDARNDTVKFIGASIKSSKTYINMNMDDFKVYRVQNDELIFDKKLTNIADGDENVGILSNFTLTFNQPLGEGAQQVFSLYEGDTQVSAEIKRVGGNEIRIAPATALKPGRDYTIKVDGITALSGNAYGEKTEIGFTTMKIYDVNALSSDIEISEDGALSSGTKKLVVDNTSQALTDVVVVAAVYEDSRLSTLIGWESIELNELKEGETEIPLVFKNNYSGVGSVKFMMFSSLGSMKPLMKNFSVSK